MRWLAAITFIAGTLSALLVRVVGPADVALLKRPPLLLAAIETAPLARLPEAPLPLSAHRAPPSGDAEQQFSILLAGDTGLNSSFQPVHAGFGLRHGVRIPFSEATSAIAADVTADVNFLNLETVVTDRNGLGATPKMFGFRTHPDGVRELMNMGFNLFSTANNHALDYGAAGAGETVKHLEALGAVQAGLGRTAQDAAAARIIERRGIRVAFAAIGIGGAGFSPEAKAETHAGQLALTDRNMATVVSSLAAADARVRLLSVHHGDEFDVSTPLAERRRLQAALAGGADIVVAHHHHVVAGVEIEDGKAIFHGLGNFLHWGTQDMGRHDMCRDYGLVARLHLAGRDGEPLALRAIEAIPVADMHSRTRRLDAATSAERIHVLNHLSAKFGPQGVRFGIETDGTGLYCAPGAERLEGGIGARCAGLTAAAPPPAALASRIETACARRVVRAVTAPAAGIIGDNP